MLSKVSTRKMLKRKDVCTVQLNGKERNEGELKDEGKKT
jgi:hypothetical protein